MFDISWSHLMLVAVVALVVIGPKDLPRVLRTVGTWVGRARAVAREFQSSLDQMVREAELEEMRKEVEKATNVNLGHEIERSIDPDREIERSLAEPTIAPPAQPEPQPQLARPLAQPEPQPAPDDQAEATTAPASEPAVKSGTHA